MTGSVMPYGFAPEAAIPARMSVAGAGSKRPAIHHFDASEAPVVAFKVQCGGRASQAHGVPQRVGAVACSAGVTPTGGSTQSSAQSGMDDELECRLQDMMHYVQDGSFPRMECAAA